MPSELWEVRLFECSMLKYATVTYHTRFVLTHLLFFPGKDLEPVGEDEDCLILQVEEDWDWDVTGLHKNLRQKFQRQGPGAVGGAAQPAVPGHAVPPQDSPPQDAPPPAVPPQAAPPQAVPPQAVPPQAAPHQHAAAAGDRPMMVDHDGSLVPARLDPDK